MIFVLKFNDFTIHCDDFTIQYDDFMIIIVIKCLEITSYQPQDQKKLTQLQ